MQQLKVLVKHHHQNNGLLKSTPQLFLNITHISKNSVSALSDSNKNRTQTITYNCLKNDESNFAEKGNFFAWSTDLKR